MQISTNEYIYQKRSSSLIAVYPCPGRTAPAGFPIPFGIRDPVGLTILGGRAPLALLISGRAAFTFFTDWDSVLLWTFSVCLLFNSFEFCSELSADSVFFTFVLRVSF